MSVLLCKFVDSINGIELIYFMIVCVFGWGVLLVFGKNWFGKLWFKLILFVLDWFDFYFLFENVVVILYLFGFIFGIMCIFVVFIMLVILGLIL